MSNPTPSNGESTTPARSSDGPARHTLRTISILLVTLLLLAGGGWWINQAGLLGQWLAPTAQTASSMAAGVQAQGDAAQVEAAAVEVAQANATTTPEAAGGPPAGGPPTGTRPQGTPPAGFPPNDQTPGQGAAGSDDAVSGEASATAAPEAAATPSPQAATASANLVTIPAVAGVKGSRLYDENGTLITTLESGENVLISGRSDDSTWLAVTAANEQGWIPAKDLIAYGLQRLAAVALPQAVAAVSTTTIASTSTNSTVTAVTSTNSSALTTVSVTETITLTPTGEISLTLPAGDGSGVTATVVIDDGRLNLRAGPGTAYTIIGKGENGTTYTVLGRNDEADWLQLQLEDDEVGWASASYLEIAGSVDDLQVAEVMVTPTVQATTTDADSGVTLVSAGAAVDSSTVSASTVSASVADGLAGTLVFQQSPGGMIYGYDLATGDLWTVTNGFDPAISPDGSTVAFVRDGGETGLYLINIDGSNERRVFERSALSSPKWSTDGQWIVFTRNDEGVECYQVSDRQCMLPDEFNKRFPMGAPSEIPLVTEYQYKLSAVDVNGDNYHDVASLNSARAADWSDAGIVYQSSAGIQITADAEGATTQTVIFDNLNPYFSDPDLQPSGGQIVFQRKGAAQTDLWVVNTDGSGLHALTQPRTTLVDTLPSNVAAAYSPDGQSIVFLSNRTDSGEAGDWHLWVMNADGSDQRQLPVDVAIEYTYGVDQVVSWGA